MAVSGTNNNTATADTDETPQDSDDASYTANLIAAPGMNVIKDGTLDMTVIAPNSRADAGDLINYTVSVQNTGNVVLTGVIISDPLLANLDCDGTVGAPYTTSGLTINVATTLTCTGSYTLTQNDLDSNGGGDGDIDNTAVADSNETGPESDPNEETLPLAPAIDVAKTLDSSTFNSPNEVRLTYSITVQNTGNVTLTNVQVTDDLVAAFPGAASFSVFSVTSGSFSVNPGFNGTTDTSLLSGTDSLAVGASGSVTLVVDVDTGGDEDFYVNTAAGSGFAPDGSTVQDNGVAAAPGFVDPALTKAANVSQASVGDTVTFTITVTNEGNTPAPNVIVTDTLPAVFDVIAVNVSMAGPALVPVVNVVPAIGVGPAPYTVTVNLGTLQVTNVVTIQIATTVNSLGNPPIVNNTGLTTSALTNNPLNDNDSVALTLGIGPTTSLSLPATGFAPGRATVLDYQPENLRYAATDVILEIPRLGLRMPIVGVPFKNGGWDVSWLGNQAGWLEGSAFPSWNGNSVLTGHVYSASGSPGPFLNLGTLKYGDRVTVHANGLKYIFEIRSNSVVAPRDSSAFKHEELSWLTLITCKEYDPVSNSYKMRVVVRAVLVGVE
jgi:LPXTG-site transpeptidase (sortase) family protein